MINESISGNTGSFLIGLAESAVNYDNLSVLGGDKGVHIFYVYSGAFKKAKHPGKSAGLIGNSHYQHGGHGQQIAMLHQNSSGLLGVIHDHPQDAEAFGVRDGQGAQDDIKMRLATEIRTYQDSLQKVYCVTGKRFLAQYNDMAFIPAPAEPAEQEQQ